MAKEKKEVESVEAFIQKIESPIKELLLAIREVVLDVDNEIGEQIKWNVPAFCYTGEMKPFDPKEYKRDMIVTNYHKKNYVLLVFPSGAKVNDVYGILEGDYKDGRRLLKVESIEDLNSKKEALIYIIKEWLKQVEK
ncbi:MAG: DUF1801 domain-containing protein [Bacteroidetes bacterium]|nr:DUF1801 domain-containing protein [Bacteroidota bacterium]